MAILKQNIMKTKDGNILLETPKGSYESECIIEDVRVESQELCSSSFHN